MAPTLKTDYMGLELASPLVVSACPLSREVDTVRQLAEAGAGAVVLFSLFEEQFTPPRDGYQWFGADSYRSDAAEFATRPHAYLDHVRALKDAVDIPIIASLNATSAGSWLEFSRSIEKAGADGLELNIYKVIADPTVPSAAIEDTYVEIVKQVRNAVAIPIAVKLAPYFTNMAALAVRLDGAGADALVMFNRFYQPTIDIERRRVVLSLDLSTSQDARLPLMWIAMLKGQVRADLAATTGIHGVKDVVRALMAGADVAMLCSVLLRHGISRLADIHRLLLEWLEAHQQENPQQIRGIMRLAAQNDSENFKRAGYAKILNRFW